MDWTRRMMGEVSLAAGAPERSVPQNHEWEGDLPRGRYTRRGFLRVAAATCGSLPTACWRSVDPQRHVSHWNNSSPCRRWMPPRSAFPSGPRWSYRGLRLPEQRGAAAGRDSAVTLLVAGRLDNSRGKGSGNGYERTAQSDSWARRRPG